MTNSEKEYMIMGTLGLPGLRTPTSKGQKLIDDREHFEMMMEQRKSGKGISNPLMPLNELHYPVMMKKRKKNFDTNDSKSIIKLFTKISLIDLVPIGQTKIKMG